VKVAKFTTRSSNDPCLVGLGIVPVKRLISFAHRKRDNSQDIR
jgi:hypothetical protein